MTVQFASQISGNGFQMHKITKSRSYTFSHFVLTAAGLPEICNWTKFCINGPSSKPTIVQFSNCSSSIFFSSKFDVNISHKMIPKVIANVHLFNFTIFIFSFNKNIFEKVIIMPLHFLSLTLVKCDPSADLAEFWGLMYKLFNTIV